VILKRKINESTPANHFKFYSAS